VTPQYILLTGNGTPQNVPKKPHISKPFGMPESAKAHIKQSRISTFSGRGSLSSTFWEGKGIGKGEEMGLERGRGGKRRKGRVEGHSPKQKFITTLLNSVTD